MVLNRQTPNKQRPLEFSKLFQIFHFEKGRSVLTIESGFNTGVNNSKVFRNQSQRLFFRDFVRTSRWKNDKR